MAGCSTGGARRGLRPSAGRKLDRAASWGVSASAVLISILLLVAALLTATLSGVFGMAGGLVLMGVLTLLLPIKAAFVTHGILQLVANGWRAVLHRRFVRWDIVAVQAAGSLLAGAVVSAVAFIPSKPLVYLLMGLIPGLLWLPRGWIRLDAAKPPQALLSGLMVTGANLTAGVAGPLLDIFFVRTELTRHAIVATKAATQVFSHLAKIVVYGAPLIAAEHSGLPPVWVFAVAVPLSMTGAVLGGQILQRMTDVNFKRWTRLIVTAIGLIYLVQAAQLWLG
jgi:uncharacterized membrane protein YfcA